LRATRHPPPAPPSAADAEEIRTGLDRLRFAGPRRHAGLFLAGRPRRVPRRERPLVDLLERHGLVERLPFGRILPRVRLFPILGRHVATDLLTHEDADQVFSLMFEQVYLVRNLDVREGDRVVELCVGSGVNALFAADRADAVAGVDVSPRALAFARFNAALNGRPDAIELLEGDLFAPVGGRRFDLVIANPPFEPVPAGRGFFLHSDGGEDGLDVVRRILAEVPDRLTEAGRLEMITWSPGSDRGPAIVPLLGETLDGFALRVDLLGEEPLDGHAERFRSDSGYGAWRARLAERDLDRLFMVRVRADRGAEPALDVRRPAAEIAACHGIADAWG